MAATPPPPPGRWAQPLEKLLAHYFRAQFFRPKIRPYRTNNAYALLMKGGVTLDPVLEKER